MIVDERLDFHFIFVEEEIAPVFFPENASFLELFKHRSDLILKLLSVLIHFLHQQHRHVLNGGGECLALAIGKIRNHKKHLHHPLGKFMASDIFYAQCIFNGFGPFLRQVLTELPVVERIK